jgi:hypothetical protein
MLGMTTQRRRRPPKPSPASLNDNPALDFLILADAAQEVAGKLYLLGGGWDMLTPPTYPSVIPFGLGVGILVPWAHTNMKHHFTFVIKASEGPDLARGEGDFEVGRKPGLRPGMTQRVVLAIHGQLNIPGPGTYEVIAQVADNIKRTTFDALSPPTHT